jgi:5-methylcytosine-specific restriction enzyme subunit McrC
LARTIHLTEYQTTSVELAPNELEQLLKARVVTVTPRLDGGYDLRPENVVGTIVLPQLRVLIKPKIGVRNLFFLLAYGAGLTRWREDRFPYAEDDDLFKAIAWLFEAEVRLASRAGLTRSYQDREERLATIRGRIDIGAQVRRWQGRRSPLECRYQDYTDDWALNRVLKAAHRRLLRIPDLEGRVVRDLHSQLRLFNEVETIDYGPKSVPTLQFNRLSQIWEPAARLAQLILRNDSLLDETGSTEGISFTVDMNRVFERFVEVVVASEARRAGYVLERQARRRLTPSVPMRPDLVLKAAGRDVAVGDAKYKELAPSNWPHADLYQLLAYCDALQLPRGLLIYADSRRPRSEIVEGVQVTLEVVGIDLEGDHRDVLARARVAARRLVEHAQYLSGSATAQAA